MPNATKRKCLDCGIALPRTGKRPSQRCRPCQGKHIAPQTQTTPAQKVEQRIKKKQKQQQNELSFNDWAMDKIVPNVEQWLSN